MPHNDAVSQHYSHSSLIESIRAGIEQMGKSVDDVTLHHFAPVDEFHIGGRQATEHLMNQLNLTSESHVLDVGCGLGGPARYVTNSYQCRVTGIDLTEDYINAGETINEWVGLSGQIDLQHGSALELPFAAESFDSGYMIHVGMNIEDKSDLFAGINRVLRQGALFGVYDIMKVGEGEIGYPVPWAADESLSKLASPAAYEDSLRSAGFEIVTVDNRRDFALEFFEAMRRRTAATTTPPALGLHILMEASTPAKISNMIENLVGGLIAPVEIIARKG